MLFCPYKRKEEGISSKAVVHILLEQHCIYHFSSVWALFKKKTPLQRGQLELLTEGSKATLSVYGRATVSCLSHTLHQMAQITPLLPTTCRGRKILQLSKWNMQAALPKWVWNIPETVTASFLPARGRPVTVSAFTVWEHRWGCWDEVQTKSCEVCFHTGQEKSSESALLTKTSLQHTGTVLSYL